VEVLLLDDVKKLGKKGDVVRVKDGYARNYLIPKGLAKRVDKGVIAQRNEVIKVMSAKERKEKALAQELKKSLESQTIVIGVKVGEGGKLYGSVTSKHIAEAIHSAIGKEVDKKKIELQEPIKKTGKYRIPVKLGYGIVAKMEVVVEEQ